MNSIKEIVQNYITRKFYRQGVYKMLCLFQRTGSWDIMMKRRDAMQKKLFAEVEGNYVRPFCSIPKYAIVTLQIYKLDTDEILFENHCPHERLPQRFAEGVEEGVRFSHQRITFRAFKWSSWTGAGMSPIRIKEILCLQQYLHWSRYFRNKIGG